MSNEKSLNVCSPQQQIGVIDNRFIFNYPVTLKIRYRIYKNEIGNFEIKDMNGVTYFNSVNENKFSYDTKGRVVYDTFGKPAFYFSGRNKKSGMEIYDGEAKDILSVVKGGRTKFEAKYKNIMTNKDEVIEMKVNYNDYLCEIYSNNTLIATVSRINPNGHNETDYDYVFVQIAPGVDAAYIIALAYTFDLNENVNNNSGSWFDDVLCLYCLAF